jgi:hypothetical protein
VNQIKALQMLGTGPSMTEERVTEDTKVKACCAPIGYAMAWMMQRMRSARA